MLLCAFLHVDQKYEMSYSEKEVFIHLSCNILDSFKENIETPNDDYLAFCWDAKIRNVLHPSNLFPKQNFEIVSQLLI